MSDLEIGSSTVICFQSKEGSENEIRSRITAPGFRAIQVTLDVNGGEYNLLSKEVECSVKDAQQLMEGILALFGHSQP